MYFIVLYTEEYIYVSTDVNEFIDAFFEIYTTDYYFFLASSVYLLVVGLNGIMTRSSQYLYINYFIRGIWLCWVIEYLTLVYKIEYEKRPLIVVSSDFKESVKATPIVDLSTQNNIFIKNNIINSVESNPINKKVI